MSTSTLIASHFGVVHFGNLDCEAVVLTTGERGYVRKQVAKLLGVHENNTGHRFRQILAEFSPKSLSELDKFESPILLPNGRRAQFFPAGVITHIASGVIDAAIHNKLHRARLKLVPHCMTIMRALATTGEVALIDEATGYQYHRAPDALQELISKLLRQSCASWERRFHPDYYRAIYRLFGWKYQGHDQNPPHVVGQITLRWVYGPVLPVDLMDEIRNRKGISDKHHQWLSEQGLAHLESQIHAVTAIARSSTNYPDFKRRCEAAFDGAALQLGLLLDEIEEGL
ncbi:MULTISPECIES: P63C domain-containing protein [Brachymonas]|uniref:P63C domain-containing protein n=1 Tax=Brachymonas TaxID=28219 RepID=UPI002E77C3BD|nr:P63C domain-containing protein [Brachymonas sp. J145]MEE1653541.1 P63C domain-containing protein [Brachymonas sp. J145]